MLFRTRPALAGVLLTSLTLLAACGDDDNGPTNDDTELTQAEANAFADELREEIAGLSTTTSLGTILNPEGLPTSPGFEGPNALRAGCPEFSEDPITDADEDGIPDDVTASFNPTDCILTSWGGQAVWTLDGDIRVRDVSEVDPAIRLTFDEFTSLFTYNNRALRREVNGSLQLAVSEGGFSGYDSTTVEQEKTGHPDASLRKRWALSFEADDPEEFAVSLPLPLGYFELNGDVRRTWGDKVRTFEVTTVEPLEYDPGCSADDRIIAGEIDAAFQSEEHAATVNVVWNGCGVAPTVTIVSGPPVT
jgi:hypothetical protein